MVCVAVAAFARYGHTLRFYIRPHFAKCSPVAALKLRLVSPTAARPRGFPKQALCKVACAGERARQPSALPGRIRALRPAACAPLGLSWHLGIGQALRALFWSVACGQSCGVCPRPPTGASPLRGIGPHGPVARPPQGTPPTAPKPWPQMPPRISRTNARASAPTSGCTATCGDANPRMICPWRGLSTWP